MHYTVGDIVDVRARDDGYTAVIAANDDIGSGALSVDLSMLDTRAYEKNPVVLWHHELDQPPIGRTTELRQDESGRIEADFEFAPDDERAQGFRNLWDRGFLRGASISWKYSETGRPELLEWSLVSVPADRDAVRAAASLLDDEDGHQEESMDAEEIRELVAAAVVERTVQLGEELAAVRASVEALSSVASDEPTDSEDVEQLSESAVRAAAVERVALLQRAASLLPDGLMTAEMTDREVLLTAIGDELPDAAERSVDYLRATLDGIIDRRAAAARQETAPVPNLARSYSGSYISGAAIRQMQRREER